MLNYIGDMNDFIGDNWEAFQEKMAMLGFTEGQVDAMSEKLSEFLADQGVV
jgi:hypothetical protein